MATQNNVIIQEGNNVIELSDAESQAFLEQSAIDVAFVVNQDLAAKAAKESAMEKLSALGLTVDEINALKA